MLLVLSVLALVVGVGVAVDIVLVAKRNRIPDRVVRAQDPTTTQNVIVDLNRRS